jgi:hypothetical protein
MTRKKIVIKEDKLKSLVSEIIEEQGFFGLNDSFCFHTKGNNSFTEIIKKQGFDYFYQKYLHNRIRSILLFNKEICDSVIQLIDQNGKLDHFIGLIRRVSPKLKNIPPEMVSFLKSKGWWFDKRL